jgi:hypothetical protein
MARYLLPGSFPDSSSPWYLPILNFGTYIPETRQAFMKTIYFFNESEASAFDG